MTSRPLRVLRSPDVLAIALLIALWLLFFWRLFTPIAADQASLKQGDFSAQFVAFATYQYQRFSSGEIPLWNPYNNGGLPFIGDTQAAVFYPPRLATIALSSVSGGWTYHALELEMTAHVLAYTLMLYAFGRRLLLGRRGGVLGALMMALVGGYSGFVTGYPPLQLALLEAAIWLPPAALGILEFGRGEQPRPRGLLLTGLALGLSWMAGHPQTSYFLTLLLTAYLAYTVFIHRWRWTTFLGGSLLFGMVAFGLAAVQLLPGLEYLPLTARADLTYDAKGNGFPFQDVVQFVFPGVVSQWSPLYIGFSGLVLALIAVWRRERQALFWGGVALVGLLWSLGANSPLYPLLYNTLPGLRFFRGQERAAYLVANGLAILAGVGLTSLLHSPLTLPDRSRLLRVLRWVAAAVFVVAAFVFAGWLGDAAAYAAVMPRVALGTVMVVIVVLVLSWLTAASEREGSAALLLIAAFELFTVGMNAPANYDSIPPSEQFSITPSRLIATAQEACAPPARVDGFRGLGGNFGSAYQLADIHGISPLFLSSARDIIEMPFPNTTAWELFAVQCVFTDWSELPIPSQIIAQGEDSYGAVNLHQLNNPRPFALLVYDYEIVREDDEARARLSTINPRDTLIIEERGAPSFPPTDIPPRQAEVTQFAPEAITITTSSDQAAFLSLALVHYPGWTATVDGQPAMIHRAFGGLSAVEVAAGAHRVELRYQPLSFAIGAILSLVTLGGLVTLGAVMVVQGRRRRDNG